MVTVRRYLSKAGHQYFTFMPAEGCDYIKEMLEFKMQSEEEIKQDSAVVVSLRYLKGRMEGRYNNKNKLYLDKSGHIKTGNISDSIRNAIRTDGFDWRPYILGSYFDTRMMMSRAYGLIIRDWRVFWIGHVGDMEHKYTLNKGKLPDDLIEQMCAAFEKAANKNIVTSRNK